MNETITRKDFLKHWLGYFRQAAAEDSAGLQNARFTLPSGANSIHSFLEECTRCYDCISVCPHEALRVCHDGSELEGYPVLEPNKAPCYRCQDYPCISACTAQALEPDFAGRPFGRAILNKKECLAGQGMFCRSCQSACPMGEKAVQFISEGAPIIGEICDGCGICARVCPAEAISIDVNMK